MFHFLRKINLSCLLPAFLFSSLWGSQPAVFGGWAVLSRAHPQSAAPVAFCQSGSELRNTLSLSLRLSSDERVDCGLDRIQTSPLDLLSELQES